MHKLSVHFFFKVLTIILSPDKEQIETWLPHILLPVLCGVHVGDIFRIYDEKSLFKVQIVLCEKSKEIRKKYSEQW